MLIRLVHLGRPADAIPFLWELAHQIQEAVDFLFELDRFQHLTARFMDRPNPRATRLHYALADLEEAVMTDLVETVQELPGCHFNTFMCDGAIIRVEEEGGVPGLRRELESIGARHGVTFSISTFDRLGGASRPKRKRGTHQVKSSLDDPADPFAANVYTDTQAYRKALATCKFNNREELPVSTMYISVGKLEGLRVFQSSPQK